MPGTVDPIGGLQGYAARLQAIVTRIVNLEVWQRTVSSGETGAAQPGDLIWSAANTRTSCLLCDGSSYATTTWPLLFTAIGYTYGGSGANFNVPDMRGRVPIGAGTGTAADASAWALGSEPTSGAGGEEKHTLTTAEMPAHTHPPSSEEFGLTSFPLSVEWTTTPGPPNYSFLDAVSGSTGSTGGGGPHNIVQPVSVVNAFIYHG